MQRARLAAQNGCIRYSESMSDFSRHVLILLGNVRHSEDGYVTINASINGCIR